MIISQNGAVDLIPEYNRALRPIFCVSEGDANSRTINLTVTSAGEVFTIPEGAEVYVAGKKQDNTIFTYQCAYSGYIVSFPVAEQMSAANGLVLCELQIVVAGDPLGSANFCYWVEPSPIANGSSSESDLNIFEQAIAALGGYEYLTSEVSVLSARMDQFARLPDGSLSTAADAELVDIRIEEDGTTAVTAGDAVREQARILKNELIDEIEITGKYFDLTWISGYNINANPNTGSFSIVEYTGRRYAGPFTSLTNFAVIPNINNVGVIATDANGKTTLNTGWKNARIDIDASAGKYFYIQCSFDTDEYVPKAFAPGELLNISALSDIIKYVIGKNVFRFMRGTLTDGINVKANEYSMYQQNISVLPFDLVIPISNLVRIRVFTFEDETGTNPVDLGYVNQAADYTIKRNTYFRLGIHYRSDVSGTKMSDLVGMYETPMYKALTFYANDYTHYNLMDCIDTELLKLRHIPINQNISVVNHRGYNAEYPENTLLAFRKSRERGFNAVETDVRFTSDGVPVCLHDDTINRTSNGTGNIADMTYETARSYDFGAWKNEKYAGQKIPSFEEFLVLCRSIGLRAYIELKVGTQEQIESLVNLVTKCGMRKNVSWVSYQSPWLAYVKGKDPKARLGLIANTVTETIITNDALPLKTDTNEVFITAAYENITDAVVDMCIDNDIPLEAFTVNTMSDMNALTTYATGVTSDCLQVQNYLYEENV